jgi:hypothetical protein
MPEVFSVAARVLAAVGDDHAAVAAMRARHAVSSTREETASAGP